MLPDSALPQFQPGYNIAEEIALRTPDSLAQTPDTLIAQQQIGALQVQTPTDDTTHLEPLLPNRLPEFRSPALRHDPAEQFTQADPQLPQLNRGAGIPPPPTQDNIPQTDSLPNPNLQSDTLAAQQLIPTDTVILTHRPLQPDTLPTSIEPEFNPQGFVEVLPPGSTEVHTYNEIVVVTQPEHQPAPDTSFYDINPATLPSNSPTLTTDTIPRPDNPALLTAADLASFYVFFGNNTADVDPQARDRIRDLALFLEQNPEVFLVIEGHSDSPGSAAYNQVLSVERAHTIKRYLVNEHNISPLQLEVVGFGESRPLFPETPPTERAKNRRVSFQLRLPGTPAPG
jgi:outer membrane protein OmpA-like peptidoglycan-associated protein